MKILFIYPKFTRYLNTFPDVTFAGARGPNRYVCPPSLAIPILTSLTPKKHEWEFVDQNIEDVDFDADADLVALSFFTPQAANAYEICKAFRGRGKTVVVGGMHPTVCPDEARELADIVCIGEGEYSWPELLEDVEQGRPQPVYRQSVPTDLSSLPVPNRRIYHDKNGAYGILLDYLEISRGCAISCFADCAVPMVSGREVRFKSIEKVLEDLLSFRSRKVLITDDAIFLSRGASTAGHYRALFAEIKRLKHDHDFSLTTIPFPQIDRRQLRLMRESGLEVLFSYFGFDPISNSLLTTGGKKKILADQARMVRDEGIVFFPSFHLGREGQTRAVKDHILEFCREAGIVNAEFCLETPWPGTATWNRLSGQKRILHQDWNKYNGANVVFVPSQMTVGELEEVYLDLWKEFSREYHAFLDGYYRPGMASL